MKIINQNGKSYGAGYAVADALCSGAAATTDVATKTAKAVILTTAFVVVGTVVGTAAVAGATVRGTRCAVRETAEVSTSFFVGFGRAFKDRARSRKVRIVDDQTIEVSEQRSEP